MSRARGGDRRCPRCSDGPHPLPRMPPARPGSADHADHSREARRATQEALDGLRDDSPSPPVIVRTSLVLVISFVAIAHITDLRNGEDHLAQRAPDAALWLRSAIGGPSATAVRHQWAGPGPTK